MLRYTGTLVGFCAVVLAMACSDSPPSSGGSSGSSGTTSGGAGGASGSTTTTGGASGATTASTSGAGGTGGSTGSGGASGAAGATGAGGSAGNGGASDAGPKADGATGGGSDAGGSTMSFFVSSTGSGAMGGNLNGLAGADMKCQTLAAAVGAGDRTWHAYLSLSGGTPVNARDRIGTGPWYNSMGVKIADTLAQLHDEGGMNALGPTTSLDERGNQVPTANPNEHDILTGTAIDGSALPAAPDRTCAGWTSNAANVTAQVGHANRAGTGGNPPTSWNSAHTAVCTMAGLVQVGGAGRIYCFATN